jgi:hypothetical protein
MCVLKRTTQLYDVNQKLLLEETGRIVRDVKNKLVKRSRKYR